MIWNSKYVLSCSIWTGDPLAHSCLPVSPSFPRLCSLTAEHVWFPGLPLRSLRSTQLLPIAPACHDIEHPLSLPFGRNTAFPLTYLFSVPTNNCYGQVQTTSSCLTSIRYSALSDFFPLIYFSSSLTLYTVSYFPLQKHCLLYFPWWSFSVSRHLCETHNHTSLKNLEELN